MKVSDYQICVIGLGYVGLPLAVSFGKKFKTFGYDINENRIDQLKNGYDHTNEVLNEDLHESKVLFTNNLDKISKCNIYIVTVPTPVNEDRTPNLDPLKKASLLIGPILKKGDIVIYESTVYPGVTEDVCGKILEEVSKLKINVDFYLGYSPERINPGDKINKLENIIKITSGSNDFALDQIDFIYSKIITAGTHRAPSIKVAESAKIVENIQRDVNIALINELHQIFNILKINTLDVIEAASTKWNFMKLTPGMVGGHCIGVDPYYLIHRSNSVGYIPDLIRTAREINDNMSSFYADDFLRTLIINNINPLETKVAILGVTFKANCTDIRNTKVIDLYKKLINMNIDVRLYDPLADKNEVNDEYSLKIDDVENSFEDVIILAVKHDLILKFTENKKYKLKYVI